MSPRTTDLVESLQAINDAIDLQGKAFELFKGKNDETIDALRGRVEELESIPGSGASWEKVDPNKAPRRGGNGSPTHKRFETDHGPVYEIPSGTKMADVIRPAKEAPVSFDRWLSAALIGDRCGDKDALEFARERKDVATTSTGVIIPQEYQSEWIDLIRQQSVLNAAGMTTVTMDGKTANASALVADPTAEWHSEAGSITPSTPTFAARTLTAKTLAVVCVASVEVAQDSPDFASQLAAAMSKAMAVEVDRVGLVGTGTPPEPHGIAGTSGINNVPTVGALTDYSKLLSAVRLLLEDNVPLDVATKSFIMSPSIWSKFESLATGITSDKTQLPRPRSLENSNFIVANHGLDAGSPTVTSTIFGGDFRDVVMGVRREASVEALKLSLYGSNLQLTFVGYLRADFLIRCPSSLVTLTGVTVPA